MSYQSRDDPQLLADVRTALRRWHRSSLGGVPLASRLKLVASRRESDDRLTHAAAVRETLLAALDQMRAGGWASEADLLHARYVAGQSIYRLQETYHLSERTIYYRLQEAFAFLAHVLWTMEQSETRVVPSPGKPDEPSLARWRARRLPPATYGSLLGIQDSLAYLLECLHNPDGHWMISVDGMGGVGKTALVREAAARVAETDRFADIAWLTVTPECYMVPGAAPQHQHALTCDQVLDGIADQLAGVDLSTLTGAEKRERVSALVRARPYLVVVDNLEMVVDHAQVLNSLWELANPSKFLFTSRFNMAPDPYPWTVLQLRELPEPHALALLRQEGRLRGVQVVAEAPADELRAILAVTGGNPLAIRLVVGQLVSLPLGQALSALADARPSTEAFYDHVFAATWDLLSARAQEVLVRLASQPRAGATWPALAAITVLSDDDLASVVAELTARSLLQPAGLVEKTYTIHPLTHHYVVRQAARHGDATGGAPDPVYRP